MIFKFLTLPRHHIPKTKEGKLAVVNIMIENGKAQLIKPSYKAGTLLQVCSFLLVIMLGNK